MKNVIVTIVFSMLPLLAWADYDYERIRAGVDQAEEMFQIESWEPLGSIDGWMGKSKLRGTVTVNPKGSLMMMAIITQEEAISVITNCMQFGEIGLTPKTEEERNKIYDAVFSATQETREFNTTLNGVAFSAQQFSVGNAGVTLSCSLNPAP